MTLTLTLTPDRERRLQTQAAQAGLALPDYLQQVINQIAGQDPPPARTLAEMLEGHIGTVEGPADLSENTAQGFAALIEAKHEAQRL